MVKIIPSTEILPSAAIAFITGVVEYIIPGEDPPLRRFVRIATQSISVNPTCYLWSGMNTSKANSKEVSFSIKTLCGLRDFS